MRKIYFIVTFIVLFVVIIVLFGSRYGLKIGNIIISPNKDKKILEQLSFKFWEDVQFKDFKAAASFHEANIQDKVDIPFYLERLFLIKPEQLDIRKIEIEEVDIDTSTQRGRVRTKLMITLLNSNKTKQPEVILYWYKKNNKWFMRLESSLHPLKKRKTKGNSAKDYI